MAHAGEDERGKNYEIARKKQIRARLGGKGGVLMSANWHRGEGSGRNSSRRNQKKKKR